MRGNSARVAPLIVIVDDDQGVAEGIRSLVRSAGFRAMPFLSAEEFLSSDQLNHTECLILDVRMPGIGGLDLQDRLAEMACRIPIIFATARADRYVEKRALDHGAVGLLQKPFGEKALFAAIQVALGSDRLRNQAGTPDRFRL